MTTASGAGRRPESHVRSVSSATPIGEIRLDKKGRPRPDGYKMMIDPAEAAVVQRIFSEFTDGSSESAIVRRLNTSGIRGRRRAKAGWSPATIHRILRNEKYVGRWVWNRTETRRDPKTGRRRQFPKSEAEWIVNHDESLRIVAQALWDAAQNRLQAVSATWPGGTGKRGFEGQKGGRSVHYPKSLLSGAMKCGVCGSAMAKVSGKNGGYFGCLGAAKGACDNKILVRAHVVERVVLAAVRDLLTTRENLDYVFDRLKEEVAALSATTPEDVRMREAEYESEMRRIDNFVEFIADGRGSKALAEALQKSEERAEKLRVELEALRRTRDDGFGLPPRVWMEEGLASLKQLLERQTERSGLLLRKLLGTVEMHPVKPDIGRPYYRPYRH
jgi:hypothetical protein